jgi:hypothetical protein
MKRVSVELTDDEFEQIELAAKRLHLRGPEEWLRLAGLNFRMNSESPSPTESRSTQSKGSAEENAKQAALSLKRESYERIATQLKEAISDHRELIANAAIVVAKGYRDGKVANKTQFANDDVWKFWSKILDSGFLLQAYTYLSKRSEPEYSFEYKSERWPHRICYGAFNDWIQSTRSVELSLKTSDFNNLYWYLDYLRDVWVTFAQTNKSTRKYLMEIEGYHVGPHMLVVRVDNGKPGRGGFQTSPLIDTPLRGSVT